MCTLHNQWQDFTLRLADEFEAHSTEALQDPDHHLGNPINAFLFVKHFTLDWDRDIEELLSNSSVTGKKGNTKYSSLGFLRDKGKIII